MSRTPLMLMLSSALAPVLLAISPAAAQEGDDRVRELEARLEVQEARIAELERLLRDGLGGRASVAGDAEDSGAGAMAAAQPAAPARRPAPAVVSHATATNRLDISGDFRLREEFNWSDADARDRTRTVLRARLRASYAVNDKLLVGAQLTTGDANDPNTTDVTLGDFVNDQPVSLDQVYARMNFGDLNVFGGKFPMVFRRTDLVWDGDVNPQGVGATYVRLLRNGVKLEARGLYFLINESSAAKGSDMLGGQLSVVAPFAGDWQAEASVAYYDYRLRSLAGADAGDFRNNLLAPGGNYLSDFNLGDVLGTLTYKGFGDRFPVGITGEYVLNFGSVTAEDSGYSFEIFAGRAIRKGDWRLAYGHMAADTDAVFAAFSHDNLGIATNYRLHSLSVDYVAMENAILNLTYYLYRPKDRLYAGINQPSDWLSRMRLNLLLNF